MTITSWNPNFCKMHYVCSEQYLISLSQCNTEVTYSALHFWQKSTDRASNKLANSVLCGIIKRLCQGFFLCILCFHSTCVNVILFPGIKKKYGLHFANFHKIHKCSTVHVHICDNEFHANQTKEVESTNSFMTQNKVLFHYASILETLNKTAVNISCAKFYPTQKKNAENMRKNFVDTHK